MNNLGGTQLLFWQAIQEAKRDGLCVFDLGRSDPENTGLIAFKDRWGAARSTLTYVRLSLSPPSSRPAWPARLARSVVPYLPAPLLRIIGAALYKHIA
jgi:lipid II:glycine glycyltransferase (peptidoglycan interpeptide bridge formation enzyme)